MNKPALHLLIAAAAAAAGWFTGAPAEASTWRSSIRRNAASARAAGWGEARPAWVKQLAAVRAVPGAGAEAAWVKWAFAIPDAEIPAAIVMLNPRSDFHALRYLYARWVKLDPAAAWASFRKAGIPANNVHFYLPDGTRRSGSGLSQSSMSDNPQSLIATRMLVSWDSVDAAAAKAYAARLKDRGSPEARDVPPDSWLKWELEKMFGGKPDAESTASIAEAATKALALPDPASRGKAIETAARTWLEKDSAAACAWLRSLPDEDRKTLRFEQFSGGAMRGAPAADRALTLAPMLQARGVSSENIEQVVAQPDALYHDFSGDPQGIHHTNQAVKDWMREDPAAARAWLAAQPEGDLTALLTGTAAGQLVRTDAAGALAMLNPTGGDQALAVRTFLNGWLETDARAAVAWAGKIEDATLRDASLATAARSISKDDPSLALETARDISDAGLRAGIYKAVASQLSWNPAALQSLKDRYPGADWAGRP